MTNTPMPAVTTLKFVAIAMLDSIPLEKVIPSQNFK